MKYRISQPLANTQFDDDKKKKKKKTTTKTKTRTLRGMSVRQADKARSGSIDRAKTTTRTTVEKAPKVKSSKLNKKMERAKKRGVSPDAIKTIYEAKQVAKAQKKNKVKVKGGKSPSFKAPKGKVKGGKSPSFKAPKGKVKGGKSPSFKAPKYNAPKAAKPSLVDRAKNLKGKIKDRCKGKQSGTHKCSGKGKRALK